MGEAQTRLESWLARDDAISRRLRIAEKPGLLRTLAAVLAHSGDSWFWLLGLLVLWLLGDSYWKNIALTLAVGIAVTAVLVMAVKFTIRRKRPEGEWGGIYRTTDPHSFPSGHAARAFMLAVLALGIGPLWLGLLLVVWAPLVGLARVAMGVHYLSDVLAGMVVGVAMGGVLLLVI
jgi:undecaprenyl-diphosphatase